MRFHRNFGWQKAAQPIGCGDHRLVYFGLLGGILACGELARGRTTRKFLDQVTPMTLTLLSVSRSRWYFRFLGAEIVACVVTMAIALLQVGCQSREVPMASDKNSADAFMAGDFVKIPAGRFLMGSPASETQRHEKMEVQHQVTLTKSFSMSKYEVTQSQFELVMDLIRVQAVSQVICPLNRLHGSTQ